MSHRLSTIEAAVEAIAAGKVVIVMDAEDRENEGDFICAAEKVTPEIVNFMITHGRGQLCMPILPEMAQRLELPLLVEDNTAPLQTAFTVPVDHRTCRTGITAQERARTVREILNPQAKPSDFVRPGHLFPLIAKEGGVLRRAGHTECAVDLCRMAGIKPAGALIEILGQGGDRATREELYALAQEFHLEIITIEALIRHRRRSEKLVYRLAEANLPTRFGMGRIIAYGVKYEDEQPIAIVLGEPDRPAGAAGAAAFGLLHRRPAGVAALRLRRPASVGHADDRSGRGRRAGLSAPGRPRHRTGREDQGLQSARSGHGHGRGQFGAGPSGGQPRLRRRHPGA